MTSETNSTTQRRTKGPKWSGWIPSGKSTYCFLRTSWNIVDSGSSIYKSRSRASTNPMQIPLFIRIRCSIGQGICFYDRNIQLRRFSNLSTKKHYTCIMDGIGSISKNFLEQCRPRNTIHVLWTRRIREIWGLLSFLFVLTDVNDEPRQTKNRFYKSGNPESLV